MHQPALSPLVLAAVNPVWLLLMPAPKTMVPGPPALTCAHPPNFAPLSCRTHATVEAPLTGMTAAGNPVIVMAVAFDVPVIAGARSMHRRPTIQKLTV